MSKVGIIGARKFRDRQAVIDLVQSLPPETVVVTSSCHGVCTWSADAAKALGLKVQIFAPDLAGIRDHSDMVERYYKRNRQLIAVCDIIHAFISAEAGLTGGTRYEVRYAKRLGKDLSLHWESGKVEHIGQRELPFGGDTGDLAPGWMSFFSETLA